MCAAKQPDKRPRQYIEPFRRLFNSYSCFVLFFFFQLSNAVFKTFNNRDDPPWKEGLFAKSDMTSS